MQVVREIATHRVIYLFEDGVRVAITSAGMIGPVMARDITAELHELVAAPPPPMQFMGGWLTFSGEWGYADDDYRRQNMAVSRRQAKLALLAAGLLDQAEAAIADAGAAAQIEWTAALEFKRSHPLIVEIGTALELTDEQIDALFEAAAGIA